MQALGIEFILSDPRRREMQRVAPNVCSPRCAGCVRGGLLSPPKLKIAKALETCSTKLTNHTTTVAANPTLSFAFPKLGASEPHELAADGQDQTAPTVPPELIGRRGNADTGRFRSRNVRLLVAFLALETFIASVVSPQLELLFHCSSMSGPYFR
jgi:hypothetical protein